MDVITLATTALALAQPFIDKTGEGIANKIGEDIWNLLKKPFLKEKSITEIDIIEKKDEVKENLIQKLNEDLAFKKELILMVENAQKQLTNNTQQIINNNGSIEKQVNIGHVSGNIQL